MASWVGSELRTKIEELANDYSEIYFDEIMKRGPARDPAATFEKFKTLVDQYSPSRGRQDFLGTAARLASNLGLGTTTKESLKR